MRKVLSISALLLYAFIYLPIIVVIVFSFNTARYGAGWRAFTSNWYRVLWNNPAAWSAAWNSLLLALCSAFVATAFGTLLGFALGRSMLGKSRLVAAIVYLPVVIPDIMMAVSLMALYAWLRSKLGIFQLGLPAMITAHIAFELPVVALIVQSRLRELDPALEEAASVLGANALQQFFHITLPLLSPAVLSGFLCSFTLSLDDFVISFFTSGPGSTTLSILIYSSVKRGITPDINALSTVMIGTSILLTVCVTLLSGLRRP